MALVNSKASLDVSQLTTANTARDGTGTLVTLKSAGALGSVVRSVEILATGTTTAGVIRLFVYDGTNNRLLAEILVPAVTPGVSTKVWTEVWTPPVADGALIGTLGTLDLPNGWSLKGATHNTETFNVIVRGFDY